jgi:very-short-patch-repair endonuclease
MEIPSFIEVVNKSNSYADLCKYYGRSNNGRQYGYFRDIIEKNNISISHWDSHKKIRKYPYIEKECPVCKSIFTTQSGHKKETYTCSYKCSNIHFSNKRHTNKSNQKKSESAKQHYLSIGILPPIKIKCIICGKEKISKNKNQKCCSNKCAAKLKSQDPEYIKKQRDIQLERVANGTHNGWSSRNILSYPEKFFISVLNNNNIKFIANKPFMGYFLDFAIEDKMIDLEIDGKQHKYADRINSDIARDKVLTDNGWKVYRIEWNSINTDAGKLLMKEKIHKFLQYYNKL